MVEKSESRLKSSKSAYIQAHGFMIVTDTNLNVLAVSENIEEYVNVNKNRVLGSKLTDCVKFRGISDIQEILEAIGPVPETFRVELESDTGRSMDYWLTSHRLASRLVFEFEAAFFSSRALGLKLVSEAVAQFRACSLMEDLLYRLAKNIRLITDFERVLVYKFDPDWHSQILAESKTESLTDSLLYKQFPASVIPPRTREHYKKNLLRLIADVEHKPVSMILSDSIDGDFDMSYCSLRGVSPSHIQYLKSLGVKTAVILSIVIKGELWGIVACYNYSEKRLSLRAREACVSLAHLAAASIEYVLSTEENELTNRLDERLYHLANILNASTLEIGRLIDLNKSDFREFIDCSGFALLDGRTVHTSGKTPSKKNVLNLKKEILEEEGEGIFCSSKSSRFSQTVSKIAELPSRVLAISPSSDYGFWLFWFREQKIYNPEEIEAGDTSSVRGGLDRVFIAKANSSKPFNSVEVMFADKLKERILRYTLKSTQKDKEEVEAHREFLASIVDSSRDGIIGFSSQSEIVSWNNGAQELFQMRASEVIGLSLSEIFGENSEMFSLLSADPSETIEKTITRKDGQTLELSMKVYPVVTSEDNPIFGAAIVRDVTAQKQAERELLLMSQQLVETNRQLEEYAWVAAHDLKEPVRTMGTYARLVSQDYGEVVDDDGKKMLDVIYTSASNAMNRIDDILSYSSLGRSEFTATVVNLSLTIDRVVVDLGQALSESGGKVIVSKLPDVMGNSDMLSLLFQNLIGNSIKFRSRKAPVVKVSGENQGSVVLIKVSDNGIGLDMRYPEKVFGMFKRLDHNYPGTGLGLSIVKRIVELHGGRIWLESKPDRGTTFFIEFKPAQ